jgi:sugar/nucleoside kinase (ribokinase family)
MNNPNSGKPNIVFVGHVVIDHNKVEQTSYVRWGSPAMFMRRYFLSSAAINPTIIASYGADFLQFASDTLLLPKKPDLEHSIVYENIYKNGYRTLYCHGDVKAVPEISPEVIEALSRADLLFLAPLTPAFTTGYINEIMQHVRPDCIKTVVPQGYFRDFDADGLVGPREFQEAAAILPNFDLVIISDEDHPHADKIAHEWKQASPKTNVIVTENAQGADIILDNGVRHIPTNPVPPEKMVDPVGLGDTFSAACAFELRQTGDIDKAVIAGHTAAREKLISPLVR